VYIHRILGDPIQRIYSQYRQQALYFRRVSSKTLKASHFTQSSQSSQFWVTTSSCVVLSYLNNTGCVRTKDGGWWRNVDPTYPCKMKYLTNFCVWCPLKIQARTCVRIFAKSDQLLRPDSTSAFSQRNANYFACFFWIATIRINYFYLIAHNSKETGEIFRISPRKSARGIRP
jgi:hypothetical protein